MKHRFLFSALMISFLLPLCTDAARAQETASPDQYTPGWVARIYGVPRGFDVSSKLPDVEIGHFIADKPGYKAGDFQDLLGVKIQSGIMWRGESFLYVKEAGGFTFIMNIDAACNGSTAASIYVGGKEIATDIGGCGEFTLVGGITLNPGVYPVDFRFAPGVNQNMQGRGNYPAENSFTMSIKGPSDSRPRPMHEVLLRKAE